MKTLFLVVGAIGSGKSSVCKYLFSEGKLGKIVFIASDEYKKKYFNEEVTKWNKGYRAADELMMEALELAATDNNVENILVEFCPMRQNKIRTILSIVNKYNLKVVLLLVHTDNADINLGRISVRNETSDKVDPKKVLQSHEYVFINAFIFMESASSVYFIDNSKQTPKVVSFLKNNTMSIIDSKCRWVKKISESLS
ncbi:MAG: ATP-binding protein [Clostridia bacterium]|jgi:predicted ABC-type ATPase|nr:ATP-binding protein [Clostridia bacterium]